MRGENKQSRGGGAGGGHYTEGRPKGDEMSKSAQKRFEQYKKQVAGEIQRAMEIADLSNKQLADKINKSEYFVWLLVNGKRLPSPNTLFDIGEATGTTAKSIFA